VPAPDTSSDALLTRALTFMAGSFPFARPWNPRPLRQIRRPRRRRARCHLRWPPRHLPLLQHGPVRRRRTRRV
jgi:hypothetical protein